MENILFGSHFYHERIRKTVAVFGSLFNDINIVRKDASGAVISQLKVPLSYAPKRDFLARIENMDAGDDGERQIALKLPRMSFEILSMGYDNTRQLPRMNQCVKGSIDTKTGQRLYSPVPYAIQFQLNIYAKGHDDALQVVEQILPYFTPHYTVSIKPLTDFPKLIEDIPITLDGVSFSDDYEASLEARRTIIYTLDFSVAMNLFKDFSATKPIITEYDIGLLDLDGDELFRVQDSAPVGGPLFGTTSPNVVTTLVAVVNEGDSDEEIYSLLTEDSSGIIALTTADSFTTRFTVRNAPISTYQFYVSSAPTNGTATASWTENLTSVDGVVTAVGSWSYTPDSDYTGTDTFDIRILYGDSAQFTQTISMTVT